MLHTLFENAKTNAAVYGWLHAQMAGFWPQQKSELNPYNPQQIFNEARAVAQQHPNNKQAVGILSSMRDMVQRKIVQEKQITQVIEIACSMWPHHKEEALQTFLSFKKVPNPSLIADLLSSVTLTKGDEINALTKVWSHMAPLLIRQVGFCKIGEV